MIEADARVALERLIAERGEDYSGLSRLIGRNPTYVQQYIKRGSPRRLAEQDRRTLACYFGVDERLLGGSGGAVPPALVPVPRLAVAAAAGAGSLSDDEQALAHFAFDWQWLRRVGARDRDMLSLIRVEGDSMTPTLADGDEILVDRGDGADRLRDGIYVLRREEALSVKRLAVHPAGHGIAICSDNPAYPDIPDCPLDAVEIVGRVLWCGRRL